MPVAITQGIRISVQSFYIPEQSAPDHPHYVFAYQVTIENQSRFTAQLISRHWIISDGTGDEYEVRGDGVIGKQPILHPGESHEYTSGSHLKSPVGTMRGSYQMLVEGEQMMEVEIPCFSLEVPGAIN